MGRNVRSEFHYLLRNFVSYLEILSTNMLQLWMEIFERFNIFISLYYFDLIKSAHSLTLNYVYFKMRFTTKSISA